VGGSVFDANLKSMAVRGRLVIIARMSGVETAQVDIKHLWINRLKVIGTTFRTRTEEERLALIEACARDVPPLLREGRLKQPIDSIFALDDIEQAHAHGERPAFRKDHPGRPSGCNGSQRVTHVAACDEKEMV
jgi:NADPH2:quinone reductase